ncbi:hypothetical protein Ctha_2265 [Chloroherpeton thalassium ATCC 35110]|uniref:Cadherin-like beta sandwich domain-containing protein n=1 Tax=Chloroherpeton thalassium (strain ATCC 35110 / GB-78) TaxID=517418 RepID=B3QWF6_CHLT3|nr:hypothetical protein [Chloroherpeton thalassium]ACF14716.1 hypothetical protein Ctha_2265 [Chloroherpeton thalassium ATCC 35110]
MKKRNFFRLLVLLLVAASANFTLTGCDDDDSSTGVDNTIPTISNVMVSVNSGTATAITFTSNAASAEYWTGDVLSFSFQANDDDEVTAVKAMAGTTELYNQTFEGSAQQTGLTFTYTVGSSDTDIIITVTDSDDEVATYTYTVNVAVAVTENSSITLGAQENVTGSFCASIEGDVYTVSQVASASNQEKVDFVYFYGSTNEATIASPDDEAVATITTFGISDWTTKNSTVFKATTLGESDFNNIGSVSELEAAYAEATDSYDPNTRANHLTESTVFAFATDADRGSKTGLVLVEELTANSTGSIKITIKVMP